MNRLKTVEHRFKDRFFRFFRPLLKKGTRPSLPLDGRTIHKVLFLRPEKIGDMVISLPVFDGLKKHFPHIKIGILGSPKNHNLIKDDPRFDRIFLYRKNLWRDMKELMAMRREDFDCVVDMIRDDSATTLFLSQLIAPGKPRIGIGKVNYRDYYDFNCDHGDAEAGHIIDHTLKLLTAFGIDSETVSGYAAPFLDKSSLEKIGRYLREITDRSPNLLKIGYNLSAGSSTRLWDEQKSAELVRRILQSCQDSVVILFTVPQERRRGESLHSHFAERTHLLPEALDLREVAALISKLDVFITPDTSLVHIARSFRVPVVGLYCGSKKNFLLWQPYGQDVGAVMSNHDDNIFDITVDQVFGTFVRITQQLSPVGR